MIKKGKGYSMGLAVAKDYAEKAGAHIVRTVDGFVIVYRNINGVKTLIWFRQSPITEKSIERFKRILSRLAHDEVWLVKLYVEPDFTEAYREIVDKILTLDQLYENTGLNTEESEEKDAGG